MTLSIPRARPLSLVSTPSGVQSDMMLVGRRLPHTIIYIIVCAPVPVVLKLIFFIAIEKFCTPRRHLLSLQIIDIVNRGKQNKVVVRSGIKVRTQMNSSGKVSGYNRSSFNLFIPDGALSIGSNAFKKCNLTSITLPYTMTTIGSSAFEDCKALTSVTLPDSGYLTTIKSAAFSGCCSLTSIVIPRGVKSIGRGAFIDCVKMTSLTLPDKLKKNGLGERAFRNCGITSLNVPNRWTSFAFEAFYECDQLTSLTLPRQLTAVDSRAFNRCEGLTSIDIPDTVSTIGKAAFAYCKGLTSLDIPDTVTTIGEAAFANCSGLISIAFGRYTTTIQESAFTYCTGITSLEIPDTVTTISHDAFYDCTGLVSVTLPNSLHMLGRDVFLNCSALTSVVFRPKVSRAFIVWSVGKSRNRNNWSLTTLHQMRNVLRLITVFALDQRDVFALDPDGSRNLFRGCTSLDSKLTAVYENKTPRLRMLSYY